MDFYIIFQMLLPPGGAENPGPNTLGLPAAVELDDKLNNYIYLKV